MYFKIYIYVYHDGLNYYFSKVKRKDKLIVIPTNNITKIKSLDTLTEICTRP